MVIGVVRGEESNVVYTPGEVEPEPVGPAVGGAGVVEFGLGMGEQKCLAPVLHWSPKPIGVVPR